MPETRIPFKEGYRVIRVIFVILVILGSTMNFFSSDILLVNSLTYEVVQDGQFGVWGETGNDTLHLNRPKLYDVSATTLSVFDSLLPRIVLIDRQTFTMTHAIYSYQLSNGTNLSVGYVTTISSIGEKLVVYDSVYQRLFFINYTGYVLKDLYWPVPSNEVCLSTDSNNLVYIVTPSNDATDDVNISVISSTLDTIASVNLSVLYPQYSDVASSMGPISIGLQMFTLENGTIFLPITHPSGSYFLLTFNPQNMNWTLFASFSSIRFMSAPLFFTYSIAMHVFVASAFGIELSTENSTIIGRIMDLPNNRRATDIVGIYCEGNTIIFAERENHVIVTIEITDLTPEEQSTINTDTDIPFSSWIVEIHKMLSAYLPGGLITLSILVISLVLLIIVTFIRSVKRKPKSSSNDLEEEEL